MFDKLLDNTVRVVAVMYPNGGGTPALSKYVARKFWNFAPMIDDPKPRGNQRSKMRFGQAIAKVYDRQFGLSSYYARDTSHWAGR